jgi:hypothetical protein
MKRSDKRIVNRFKELVREGGSTANTRMREEKTLKVLF